jgi:hypothetical protein
MSSRSGSESDSDGKEVEGGRRREDESEGNGSMWSHLSALRSDVNELTRVVTKLVNTYECKEAEAEEDSGVKKRKSRGARAVKESLKRSGISSWSSADHIAVREYVTMRIPYLVSVLFRLVPRLVLYCALPIFFCPPSNISWQICEGPLRRG